MARFTNVAPAAPYADTPVVASRAGHFWIGAGERGPMYVYWEAPAEVTKPYPIVLVHGGGGQGLDYLGTPDGRPGWATLLVQQGWVVYVVDRPGHGRSPYIPDLLGPMGPPLPLPVLKSIFVPASAGAPLVPGDDSAKLAGRRSERGLRKAQRADRQRRTIRHGEIARS